MHILYDKHQSSGNSQGTRSCSIPASGTVVKLDNASRKKSYTSPISINSLMEIGSETSKDNVWSVIDRFHSHQNQIIESSTDICKESGYNSTGREWGSVAEIEPLGFRQLCGNQRVDIPITVEERPPNYDANNSYGITKKDITVRQLSNDNDIQCDEDLLGLLSVLKSEYQFRDEVNKDVLYDDEIKRFSVFYGINNVCPLLSRHNSIFWLKNPDGVIYMWSRTDDMMIHGGNNLKEALKNFLFHQENLHYINEYTHELISVQKVKNEAKKWYEENETAIETVVFDKSLKLVEKQQRKKLT